MINDEQIDLTTDSKFSRRTRPMLDPLIEDIRRIPWLSRPVTSDMLIGETGQRRVRSYGDPFSDDIGFTVRRTSNNGWFFAGDIDKKPWFDNMFEELLYEYGLKLPVFNICPRCGNKRLSIHAFDVCPKCIIEEHEQKVRKHLFKKKPRNNEKYIPWENYRTRRIYSEDYSEFREEIITNIDAIEQIVK